MTRRLTVVVWPTDSAMTSPGLTSGTGAPVTSAQSRRFCTSGSCSPTSDW